MKYITTKKMKQLDRIAIERYGIPSLILMENAGRGIADLADRLNCGRPARIQHVKKGTGKKYYLSYPGFDGHFNSWTIDHKEVSDVKARQVSERV